MKWYADLDPNLALTISVVVVFIFAIVLAVALKKGRISKRGFFPICVLTIFHPFFWAKAFESPEASQKSGALVFSLAAMIVFFWGLYRPTLEKDEAFPESQ